MGFLDLRTRGKSFSDIFRTKETNKEHPLSNSIDTQTVEQELSAQDAQIAAIHAAEAKFSQDGEIDCLISFWEEIWATGGLLFRGSKWAFRLPDLYIMTNQKEKALKILKQLKRGEYKDNAQSYINKIS